MQINKYKQYLTQYLQLKNNTQLSFKAKLYFSTLQLTLEKNHSIILQKQELINYSFIEAFLNQSPQQKISFLLKMLKFYKSQFDSNASNIQNIQFSYGKEIKVVQTTCQMQVFNFGIPRWTNIRFKYDKVSRLIILTYKKNYIKVEFQWFLVRKSKRYKNTLIFQSIKNNKNKQKISLFFNETLFNQIQGQILNSIFEMRKKDFLSLINQNDNLSQKYTQPHLVLLNSQNIISFIKFKTQISKIIRQNSLKYDKIFQKQYINNKIIIQRGTKFNKIFKMQFVIDQQINKFKSFYLNCLKNKYCYQRQYIIIEQYSNKYQAINQRFIFNNKIYQQISLKQQNINQHSQIYSCKGIQNIVCINFIEFLNINVKAKDQKSIVVITASLKIDKQFTQEQAKQFMIQFYQMTQRNSQVQQKIQSTLQQQFYTVLMQQEGDFQDVMIEIQDEVNRSINSDIGSIPGEKQAQIPHNFYKKINTVIQILSQEELNQKIMKNHYYSGQFQRYKSGGIICVNEKSIAEQKKIFKKVITSLGSRLFQLRSGGILNVSLPVQIFKKQSHLQSIAANFLIAPLFLDPFQNSQDYLQRIKFCILTTISMTNLGIGSQKPFNPILGQTFQCWIGGCPVYLQQISHHPPSSAYYMIGRGYTISGIISAKISFSSLNSGKFWSEKPHIITFDDGSTVIFTLPKTLLRGLIYGDRYNNFQGKCYVYDMKNHYFGQIQYGPINRGFMKSALEPQDYLHGNIYRTTTAFLQKFKKSPTFPDQEDKAKQICKIEGIWNQQIKFDNQIYTNFSTLIPYILENQVKPLPSNSLFRKDLAAYITDDIVLAQQQKENMQNIQRRDKKLRDKYRKVLQNQ